MFLIIAYFESEYNCNIFFSKDRLCLLDMNFGLETILAHLVQSITIVTMKTRQLPQIQPQAF